jgi:hypothetical protein
LVTYVGASSYKHGALRSASRRKPPRNGALCTRASCSFVAAAAPRSSTSAGPNASGVRPPA